ncbi:MAG: hypothetical protein ACRDNL_03005 [Spirillospora sp.]
MEALAVRLSGLDSYAEGAIRVSPDGGRAPVPAPDASAPGEMRRAGRTASATSTALLARLPQDAMRDNADVTAIALIADDPEDLETLDAYPAGLTRARLALTLWRLLDDRRD